MGIPLNCFPGLGLKARYVLQKVYLSVKLFMLDLLQTILKGLLLQSCKMNRFIHGLNCSVAGGFLDQGISTETVLIRFFVYFFVIEVVDPLVSHLIDRKLV